MKTGSKEPTVIAFKKKTKEIKDTIAKVNAEHDRLEHAWQHWQEGDRISEAEVVKCEGECCAKKPTTNGGA